MHCHPRYTLVSSRLGCWSPTPRPREYHSCPVSLNTSWPRLEWRRTLKFWNYWMEKIHKHWPRWWPTPWSRCPNGYWLRRRSIAQSSHRYTKVTNTRTRTTKDQQNNRKECSLFWQRNDKECQHKKHQRVKMLLNKNVAQKIKNVPPLVAPLWLTCNDVVCVTLPLDIFNPPLIVVFDPVTVMALVNVPATMTLTSIAAVSAVLVTEFNKKIEN